MYWTPPIPWARPLRVAKSFFVVFVAGLFCPKPQLKKSVTIYHYGKIKILISPLFL